MIRIFLIIPIIWSLIRPASAQEIPLGTWRAHPSYRETTLIADAGDRIYGAAVGGLYYYDLQDQSVNRLTPFDGFQSGRITALSYDPENELLLIGYATGNMDIYDGKDVFFTDLTFDSQITGSKMPNHILPAGNFAYISTDYGIIKYDLLLREPYETYRELGEAAAQIPVYSTAIYRDSLFAVTSSGIQAGSLATNLSDFRNWRRYSSVPAGVHGLTHFGDQLYTAMNGQGLYTYNGEWTLSSWPAATDYRDLSTSGERLIVTLPNRIIAYMANGEIATEVTDNLIGDAYQALLHDGWWIADGTSGLISGTGNNFEQLSPSGPYSSDLFSLTYAGGSVWGLSGGYSSTGIPLGRNQGYYRFQDGQWVNSREIQDFPVVKDLTDVAVMPGTGDIYIASAGEGLLKVGEDIYTLLDDQSPGSTLINTGAMTKRVVIPSIARGEGGLWMLNYGAAVPVHFLSADGSWEGYSPSITLARFGVQILPVGDLLWIRINPSEGGGLVVFNPQTNQSRYLNETAGQGSLVDGQVNDMALDKDGSLWLATTDGISVIYNPFQLEGTITAAEPVFEGRPLLVDEDVREVAVDGGNRKWFGTGNGAWLFDDRTDVLLHHFTTENSPLPENDIRTLAIHGITGEVFFGTDDGIVSYRADATEGSTSHTNVKIFPNPVQSDFNGMVGFSGLAADAIVKITDISGRLIFETTSEGGTASWDMGSPSAAGLSTGMYLVWSTTEDGSETYVGKLGIIR